MRGIIFLIAAATAVAQQDSRVILSHSFTQDTDGWIAMGQDATVRVTRDPAQPTGGRSSLVLTYPIGTTAFSAAVLPIATPLASLQTIRFRAKSDHDTAVAMLLTEKKPGGGDYSAWFWAPANTWQQIELTPSDFSLNSGPKDAVDADGKLDLDQIQAIGVFDLAHFFTLLPENSSFPVVVSRHTGTHTLWLSDFQILNLAPPRRQSVENAISIDTFDRGFLEWITLGGMDLKLSAKNNPLGSPALQASYEDTEGKYAVLVRRLSNLDLAPAKRLVFDIASERDITLAISLELKQPGSNEGPRYTTTIFPPADRKPFHVNLNLADFELDANSPVPGPAGLPPSKLKSIAITDVTAAAGGETAPNKIWIANLQALTR